MAVATLFNHFVITSDTHLHPSDIHINHAQHHAGFAFITGLFSYYNRRGLDAPQEPRTYTFDAEIHIGDDQNGQLQCVNRLLHYFLPQNQPTPEDNRKFFVSGKLISIHSVEVTEYDIKVEALMVCLLIPWCNIYHISILVVLNAWYQQTSKSNHNYCRSGNYFYFYTLFHSHLTIVEHRKIQWPSVLFWHHPILLKTNRNDHLLWLSLSWRKCSISEGGSS